MVRSTCVTLSNMPGVKTRLIALDDVPALTRLLTVNRDFQAPWDPVREDVYFTEEGQKALVEDALLGYWVNEWDNGKGVATSAVGLIRQHAFGELGLHRIEAGTLPENQASQRVLERNGFVQYGIAPAFLKIAGEWRDHVLYQCVNPDRR
jgi:[ribosomal protein S5]-alanine N-acetyltransferase